MTQPLGYVRALDGVRAIAIVAVLGAHFFGLPGGGYGVDLFFVLSGFLITTLLLEEHSRSGTISLAGFYLRRVRRLMPAFFAMVVFVAVIEGELMGTGRFVEFLAAGALYGANIARAYFPSTIAATPLDHTWSLAMEEQFYLVWPPILALLLRRRMTVEKITRALAVAFVILAAYRIVLVLLNVSTERIHYSPESHADGLVIGCLLAVARARGLRIPGWAAWPALTLITVALGGGKIVGPQLSLALVLPLVEVAAAVLILAVTATGRIGSALSFGPIVWIGTISYSLYVWHQPARWITGSRTVPGLALSLVLAIFSFYVIERPFRRQREPAAQATPATA